MIKIILPALVSAMLLAACASPAELRGRKPDLELSSDKGAKAVALCIVEQWESNFQIGNVPVSMRETANGYAVLMNCNGNACLLADVTAIKGASKTLVRTNSFIGTSDYLNHARACQ